MTTRFRILLLMGCIGALGCAPEEPAAIVRGKVTYKNAPLDQGSIVFFSAGSSQASYGNLQKDGTFQLMNASKTDRIEPGKYVAVVIAGTDQIAQLKEDPLYPVQPRVPLKFSSATTSPLKYDVKVGLNEFEINLDKM